MTHSTENLFNDTNHDNLEQWSNRFRFCSCQTDPSIFDRITDKLVCDQPSTDLTQVCEETLTDDTTVRCDLARRKKSIDDTHTSPATRKTLQQVEKNKSDYLLFKKNVCYMLYILCLYLPYMKM